MSWDELENEITRRLDKLRPARYSDTQRMNPVIDWASEQLAVALRES